MRGVIYIVNRMVFVLILCLVFSLAVVGISAAEANELDPKISGVSGNIAKRLLDGSYYTYDSLGEDASMTLSCDEDIGSLYIVFDKLYGEFSLTDLDSGKSVICGKNGFLHTYLDVAALLGENIKNIKLDFENGEVILADIYVFGKGEVPSWVQKWKPPADGEADLLLISSHSDDEHLFFAGALPYYALERGLKVQVVYFTHHFDTHSRPHEQLNGLWTVGVKCYPIISEFPDLYSLSLDGAMSAYARAGYSEDDFIAFQVEMLRRFKPYVVLGHDAEGEYGHGTHRLNSLTLRKAVGLSADKDNYPESAEKYGTWDTPKTYIHLWEENKIVMDWDTPYDSLGGKTPYELSVKGYECHKSQHVFPELMEWLAGTSYRPIHRATEIKGNSPCEYGLFRSMVGEDVAKNDFFENIAFDKDINVPENVKSSREIQAASKPVTAFCEKAHDIHTKNINITLILQVATVSLLAFFVTIVVILIRKIRKYNEK